MNGEIFTATTSTIETGHPPKQIISGPEYEQGLRMLETVKELFTLNRSDNLPAADLSVITSQYKDFMAVKSLYMVGEASRISSGITGIRSAEEWQNQVIIFGQIGGLKYTAKVPVGPSVRYYDGLVWNLRGKTPLMTVSGNDLSGDEHLPLLLATESGSAVGLSAGRKVFDVSGLVVFEPGLTGTRKFGPDKSRFGGMIVVKEPGR
jgi:hypothetical protein